MIPEGVVRNLRHHIAGVRKAETKDQLKERALAATGLVKAELLASEERVVRAMRAAVREREQLLELLRSLKDATAEGVGKLK